MIKQLGTIVAGFSLGALSVVQAASFDFVGWDFNTYDSDGSTGTLTPFLGIGQLTPVGSTLLQFGFTAGSSEPGPDNSALWLVAPAGSGVGDQIGAEFAVSTGGRTDIGAMFDLFFPSVPTSAFTFEYSVDNGANWTQWGTINPDGTSTWGSWTQGLWANVHLVDFSTDPLVNNNPDFRFRIVTTLTGNVPADQTVAEVDRVIGINEVAAVPEPTEWAAAMGLGLAALAGGRRLWQR